MKRFWHLSGNICRVVVIIFLVLLPVIPALAAESTDITITATPMVSHGITGFTITYINDTQLDLDWGYSGNGSKAMIRVKDGEYPDDIPDENTEPTDGYLVYFGDGTSTSDTAVDFNNSTLQKYYKVWAQKDDGTWYTDTSTGAKENPNMVELTAQLGVISQTVIILVILFFIVGLSFWHRDPWLYAGSGFAMIIYGLHMTNTTNYTLTISALSVIVILIGVYCFAKALWDRQQKSKK